MIKLIIIIDTFLFFIFHLSLSTCVPYVSNKLDTNCLKYDRITYVEIMGTCFVYSFNSMFKPFLSPPTINFNLKVFSNTQRDYAICK